MAKGPAALVCAIAAALLVVVSLREPTLPSAAVSSPSSVEPMMFQDISRDPDRERARGDPHPTVVMPREAAHERGLFHDLEEISGELDTPVSKTAESRAANAPANAAVMQVDYARADLNPLAVQTPLGDASVPVIIEAFREAAAQQAGSSVDSPGRSIRGARARASREAELPAPTAAPEADQLQMLGGQARGYAMLSLMHPRARTSSEAMIDTMLRARIRDLYLGVLVDGTFSFDTEYLESVIRRLNSGGRALTLGVYLTNGATPRQWDRTPIRAPFTTISPERFRSLVFSDPATRETVRALAERILPALDLNRGLSPHNRNVVSVMLEDNLDAESYRAMRTLVQPTVGDRAVFIRNPCFCYRGSDFDPQGDPLETHLLSNEWLNRLGDGDGLTLDGVGFRFPAEPISSQRSLAEVERLLDDLRVRRLAYVGLWREQRQGITPEMPHPDQRTYEVPTEEQSRYEIELLRYGLAPIE